MALVGIVVVSHSHPLAQAAVDFAMEMVHGPAPAVRIAAGRSDGGFGTDAVAVSEAIIRADAGAGAVVLVDVGSAIMSAEMALELLDDAPRVRIVPAPFVEGLVAAIVQAATGASLDEVAAEASRALQPKQDFLSDTPAEAIRDVTNGGLHAEAALPNPAGMHARPAARIVAEVARFDASVRVAGPGGSYVNASSPIALASLRAAHGDKLLIETSGPQARAALDAVVALIDDGFGELTTTETASREPSPGPSLSPIGVSPGRVVGPCYLMIQPRTSLPDSEILSPENLTVEVELLRRCIESVARDYERRSATTSNPEIAGVLQATAVLARDESLQETAIEFMTEGRLGAASAFWRAANQAADMLAAVGGRMAERTTDVYDIRNRVVSQVLGEPMPGLPEPGVPYILLAHDVAPSDMATLTSQTCLAIVTREGGRTSHTSILARSMGIPAVVGYQDIEQVSAGGTVLVDGTTGEVIVSPSPEQYATASTRVEPMQPLSTPGALSDGTRVPLLANIGSEDDAQSARAAAAEGIGLFRTEICFLENAEEPSLMEQVRIYSEVLECFPGAPVVVRTLDAGSDKPIPFLGMAAEDNPALGLRGYRTAASHPGVLERQLEALAQAVAVSSAHVSVMAPMISTLSEAEAFAGKARAAGLREIGIMIETPSAALAVAEILDVVDFVSIGTNDLAQYTMAADRLASGLAELQDPWQPAVLRLIQLVGRAGAAAGKRVGVCGEAAADPALAPVLVGLGVTSLSMSPRSLFRVGEALARVSPEQCARAAQAACEATDPAAARRAAIAHLG